MHMNLLVFDKLGNSSNFYADFLTDRTATSGSQWELFSSVKYGNIEFPGGGIPGNSGWGWGVSLGSPNPSPFSPIFRAGPGSSKDG